MLIFYAVGLQIRLSDNERQATALSISIFNTLIHLTTVVRLHLTFQAFHSSYEQNYTDSPQVFLQSPV